MSVGASMLRVQEMLNTKPSSGSNLVIACNNSPGNVTVSGEEKQIDAFQEMLKASNVFNRKLKVNVAYHSPQMDKVAEEYACCIHDLEPGNHQAQYPAMISTVTGQRIGLAELLEPSYWVRNMVSAVSFVEAVEHICGKNVRKKLDGSHLNNLQIDICLEIGPHPVLAGPVRDITGLKGRTMHYFPTIHRSPSIYPPILETAGKLHCLGYPVNLLAINEDQVAETPLTSLSNLPEYPFDHSKKYMHEGRVSKSLRLRLHSKLDLLGKPSADWNPMEAKWRNFIGSSELPWLEDHKVRFAHILKASRIGTDQFRFTEPFCTQLLVCWLWLSKLSSN